MVGIQINPYDITDDGELLSSNGNLLLMDEYGNINITRYNVKKVGYGAFSGVEGLKTIIIPGSVKEIAEIMHLAYNQNIRKSCYRRKFDTYRKFCI